MIVWNKDMDDIIQVIDPPKITSMCIHDNRMFATIQGEARSIIFSEELNPINFNVSSDEGGYINMQDDFGNVTKLYHLMVHYMYLEIIILQKLLKVKIEMNS